jgi:VCBS repeat-containing protein
MDNLLTRLAAAAVIFTFALPVLAQSVVVDDQKVFHYATAPEVVILSYSETPGMLASPDTLPRIQVFGDGWVWIHYPVYMKKAGDYGLYLNPGEITALLKSVSGAFGFEAKAARDSRDNIKLAREMQEDEAFYRSDGTLEEITVNLTGYQDSPGAPIVAVNQAMAWTDIALDARDYPELQELQNLNRARDGMRDLLARDDLTPVDMSPANGSPSRP